MSAAVEAGFNPYKARLAPDMMDAAGLGSSYAAWRESAIHGVLSQTDWNVCDTCMSHLKAYLEQLQTPRVQKSSRRSGDPKTDPSALAMRGVLSQDKRSKYTSTSLLVKSCLVVAGIVGAGVVLAATLFFSTRNAERQSAPSKNAQPSAKALAAQEGVRVRRTEETTFQTELGELKNEAIQPPGAILTFRGSKVAIVFGYYIFDNASGFPLNNDLAVAPQQQPPPKDRKLKITLVPERGTKRWIATDGVLVVDSDGDKLLEGHVVRIVGGRDNPVKICGQVFSDTTIAIRRGQAAVLAIADLTAKSESDTSTRPSASILSLSPSPQKP